MLNRDAQLSRRLPDLVEVAAAEGRGTVGITRRRTVRGVQHRRAVAHRAS
jgi:hypothetical protein